MKKFFVCMLILVSAISVFAQRGRGADPHWLTLAVKGGYGNSILFCKEINDDENISQNFMSPSFSIGGKLGVVLKDRFGITCEVLSSNYQNKFEIKESKLMGVEIVPKHINSYKFKTLDVLAGFRYTSPAGVFVELGPKFTMIKKANFNSDLETSLLKDQDAAESFVEKYVSPFFGFGVTPYNGDRFQVTIGLRGAYCPKNILNQEAIQIYSNHLTPIKTDKVSPFSAQALLELNYYFATFGKATCGKGAIKFF